MEPTKTGKKKLSLPLKILVVLIILVTVFLCSAILSDSVTPSVNNTDNSQGATNNSDVQAEVVLVDNDKIKATYIGANDGSSLGVFYVTLKIENKTETNIAINLESADVDGETIPLITTGVPLVIRPENSGQTSFIFSMVNLSISAMNEAKQATFKIVARDNDSYDPIYTSDFVTVNLH